VASGGGLIRSTERKVYWQDDAIRELQADIAQMERIIAEHDKQAGAKSTRHFIRAD
jgi:hypothetical protein